MKGFTHFLCGIAVATAFGLAVDAAAEHMAQIIILGGIFGYMPDFLDFKVARFLEDYDYEVDPTLEGDINAQRIAELFVEAIHKARDTGKYTNIKFNTMKIGADTWRQYGIMVDNENKRIIVKIGPLVTTGKSPIPETTPPDEEGIGVAHYDAELEHTYEAWTYADIMSGPDYGLVPQPKEGNIRLDFIPWHRKWSHSLTCGLAVAPFGLLAYLGISWLFAGSDWVFNPELAVVVFMICLYAYWLHVIVDQFGVMGSNLFPPFTKKRSQGLSLFHSGLSIANFGTNWISVAVILYNLNYFADERVFGTNPVKYFVLTTIIPLTILVLIRYFWLKKTRPKQEDDKEEQKFLEKIDEIMEYGSGDNV